jgi:hypothetical protein
MKMSFIDFDKQLRRGDWKGHTYFYETDSQKDAKGLTVRLRLDDVALMFSPNCMTFKGNGGSLSIYGVRSIDCEQASASCAMLTIHTDKSVPVYIYVR